MKTLDLAKFHIDALRQFNICAVEIYNDWKPPYGEQVIGEHRDAKLRLRVFGSQEVAQPATFTRTIILVPALDPIGE